jgi:hypothetical protein
MPYIRHLIVTWWGCLTLNVILVTQLSEYLKLEELTIIMVLGSFEDEKNFSTMKFMKSKFCNCLIIRQVVKMFVQKFYKLNVFPF